MDSTAIALANAIVGFSAAMSALTGFGYALVAAPFLVLVFPPHEVVPVVMVSWIPLAALLLGEARGAMNLRRIGGWLTGAVVGIPVGVYGLAHIAEGPMRVVIGGITVAAALAMWVHPARPWRHEAAAAPIAGLLSGLLGGASGMSGPPVVLFALNQGWPPAETRANLIGYFVAKHAIALVSLALFGVLDRRAIELSLWAMPGLGVGAAVGLYLKSRVPPQRFRQVALVLVLVGGGLAIARH